MLILNAEDVRRALPMRDAIEAMKQAFAAFSSGQAVVPERIHLEVPDHDGVSLFMPALVSGDEGQSLAIKAVSVFDRNAQRGLARIQAAVLVLEPDTGRPVALLEGASLTGIRTAAGSGAATDLLARSDSRTLAVFGAGVQARTHIEAVCTVRAIKTVWIYGPTPSKVQQLIGEVRGHGKIPDDVRAAASPGEALADADIVCTTTTSKTPVFDDADLKPGVHVNAVGSYQPHVVEIPSDTVARALIVVDSREAAWQEAGDLIQPLEAGRIGRNAIYAELGEIVLGQRPSRQSPEQITLFKSVGIAVQDAVAASVALRRADELGIGTRVDW